MAFRRDRIPIDDLRQPYPLTVHGDGQFQAHGPDPRLLVGLCIGSIGTPATGVPSLLSCVRHVQKVPVDPRPIWSSWAMQGRPIPSSVNSHPAQLNEEAEKDGLGHPFLPYLQWIRLMVPEPS